MTEKRGAEEVEAAVENGSGQEKKEGERVRKRSRFGAPANAQPAGTEAAPPSAAPGKPAVPNLEVLEKAKKALQLQKELKAKLKNLPLKQVPAAPGPAASVQPAVLAAAAAAAAAVAAPVMGLAAQLGVQLKPAAPGPAPLFLDASGREVDAEGKPVEVKTKAVSTFKVNLADRMASEGAQAEEARDQEANNEPVGFDPRMGTKGLRRMERRRRDFKFVAEGVFQRQAELARVRAKYGDKAFRQMQERQERERREAKRAASLNLDPNAMPLGERAAAPKKRAEVPAVEWWDAGLLPTGTYEDVGEEVVNVQEGTLTVYVEHPVPIEPPLEDPMPGPQPLKLTKVELKKLRTQRRRQREMEKQELIRQGLLEPAKPKVKISNLMRVLGAEAAADPTKIEKEVRLQMEERQMAHEDRNLARKLTPAEKRDKKIKKLFGDPEEESGIDVAVYRVEDLSFKQHIYKVDINAQENRLTGTALTVEDGFSLVIVEGSSKAQKRYKKLMLRRIDWNPPREDEDLDNKPPNSCNLVWEGVVQEPAFERFSKEICSSKSTAKKILESLGVGHYWDLAENWQPETGA